MSRKTNWNKWRNLAGLGALGLFILFQHQNCAPAPGGAMADDSSPVGVINPVNQTSSSLRFTQDKVQTDDTVQSAVLDGECDRIAEGTVVGWDVQDGASSFSGGYVSCDRGRFQVEIANRELECGKVYEVSARLEDGTEGRAQVEMVCAN
ncbi:MAG: hypothetical protein V4760_07685 [Bdellovibrionota bacterium]